MQAALTSVSAAQREQLDACTDGVNAGLASLSVRPFAYLLTHSTHAPWRNEDTLLVIAAMAFTLNDAATSASSHSRRCMPHYPHRRTGF